jgi:hypothetical protein
MGDFGYVAFWMCLKMEGGSFGYLTVCSYGNLLCIVLMLFIFRVCMYVGLTIMDMVYVSNRWTVCMALDIGDGWLVVVVFSVAFEYGCLLRDRLDEQLVCLFIGMVMVT